MSIRTERVARLLQREIADLLQTDYTGHIKPMITVTGVRVTKDLSIAYVYLSIMGDSAAQKTAAFRHLNDQLPEIRTNLASRIRHQLRVIPEIKLFLDESLEEAQRMEDLFGRIQAERERREDSRAQDPDVDGDHS